MNLEDAQEKVLKLFSLLGLEKVICVDDAYDMSIDKLMQILLEKSPSLTNFEELREFDSSIQRFRNQIREGLLRIKSENPARFQEIYLAILKLAEVDDQPDNAIAQLFNPFGYEGLSPDEWAEQQTILLERSELRSKTLFLFDQRFHNVEGGGNAGMRLIQKVLGKHNDITCGLISSTFSPEEEHDTWLEFTSEYELDKNRFALISKNHTDYQGRIAAIRLMVLNPRTIEFIDRGKHLIEESTRQAVEKLKQLDTYDLEHMIFRSSHAEGVWEFDTLSRIVHIYQRRELLRLLSSDSELQINSEFIRKIVDLSPQPVSDITESAKMVRQWELYEDKNYLNSFHLPLELGDIFQYRSGKKKKYFILLSQPCDLMVRDDGSRRKPKDRFDGVLAELKKDVSHDQLLSYKIEDFLGKPYYVWFTSAVSINLTILDLCVFSQDGQASWEINQEKPRTLIRSWRNRFDVIHNSFSNNYQKYDLMIRTLNNGIDFTQDERTVFQEVSHYLMPRISREHSDLPEIQQGAIIYPIKRIARLRQPNSGFILTRYSQAMSRHAFEHDFTLVRGQ